MKNLNTLIEELNADKDIKDLFQDYKNSSMWICDAISERADSMVDIYYYNCLEWAKSHLNDIEDANAELGVPEDGDIIKQIQQAQFLVNERDLYDNLRDGILWAIYKEALTYSEEVTDEQAEALELLADKIDNNTRMDAIEDGVREIMQPNEE
jgi:hypothetical protein